MRLNPTVHDTTDAATSCDSSATRPTDCRRSCDGGGMLTFAGFAAGPGGGLCCRLGIPLDAGWSWDDLTAMAIQRNRRGALVDAARLLDGVLSSGERAVLHAILHAADFDALADELSGKRTWARLSRVGGAHRNAVLACIARREGA